MYRLSSRGFLLGHFTLSQFLLGPSGPSQTLPAEVFLRDMFSIMVYLLCDADRFSFSSSKPVGRDFCKNFRVFIVNFLLQYIFLSKRFVPETLNFLCGILFLASKKESPTRKYQPTPCAFQ